MSGTIIAYLMAVILIGSGFYDVLEKPEDYTDEFIVRKVN
jgi:hypothetical protein